MRCVDLWFLHQRKELRYVLLLRTIDAKHDIRCASFDHHRPMGKVIPGVDSSEKLQVLNVRSAIVIRNQGVDDLS